MNHEIMGQKGLSAPCPIGIWTHSASRTEQRMTNPDILHHTTLKYSIIIQDEDTTQYRNAKKNCDGLDSAPASITSSQPPPTIIGITATELLSFLQSHENLLQLQIACPLFRQPLPSININLNSSIERTIRIEFSLRASEVLIKHIQ